MKNRAELIEALADFAGPLGPCERFEDGERRREAWLAELDAGAIEGLLSILAERPDPSTYRPACWEDLELQLVEALASAGRHDPRTLLARIVPMLGLEQARPAVIDVMGTLGLRECVGWLRALIEAEKLTTDEIVRLACALGEIGGAEARRLLHYIREMPAAADAEAQEEIEIALRNAREVAR